MATDSTQSLTDLLDAFTERWVNTQNFYLKTGTATEIDQTDFTFTFVPIDESGDIPNVKIKTVANDSVGDFLISVPTDGSKVIVAFESHDTAFCLLAENVTLLKINCNDVRVATDSYVFNDGDFGGLIKIVELTEKLNDLTTVVNSLITDYNTHLHVGVTSGPSSTGIISTPPVGTADPFIKADYEDTKIKH